MEVYVSGVIGGVVAGLVGLLWYGPLFGSIRPSNGVTGSVERLLMLLVAIAVALAFSAVYAVLPEQTEPTWALLALSGVFWVVAVAPLKLQALWLSEPRQPYYVTAGYWAVALLVMAVTARVVLN